MPNFHIAKIGVQDRQWTIITAGDRQWEQVEYATTIYEVGALDLLKDILNSGTFEDVATLLNCNTKRVEKLRQRLGIAMPLGGDRRSKEFQEHYAELSSTATNKCAMLGGGSRALLLVSARKTDWVRVLNRQIVIEERITDRFADWLKGVSNADAAAELSVAISKILSLRKQFNAPSPNRRGGNG